MLEAYCTGVYTDWYHRPFSALRWMPRQVLRWVEKRVFDRFRRSHPDLDPHRVKAVGAWGSLSMALLRSMGIEMPWLLPWFRGWLVRFQRQVAAMSRRQADVMVLYDTNAYHGFRAIEDGAVIRVMDSASTHPAVRDEIYRQEAARWPSYSARIPFPSLDAKRFQWLQGEAILSDYILVGSAWARSTYEERGFDPGRIYVVPYGCDAELFHPAEAIQRDDVQLRILFVGSASAAKGFPYLVEMARQLRDLEVEIVCCGLGPQMVPQGLDLGRVSITALGFLPQPELAHLMREVDILCHPSVLEGFSLTCLEAMASGLVVVTTPRSGTAEIIENEKSGFIVPVGDSAALGEVMRRLYSDGDLRRVVGCKARETAECYTWQAYEAKIEEVFRDIYRRGVPE